MKPTTISLALFAAFGLSVSAHAFEPFVIKEIRVEGIQRTEAGTVFNYLPVKVGDRLDDDKASAAVKALYATGFYDDVRIETDHDVLIVSVDERPVIADIKIEGSKEIESDQLLKALKENGLAESRIFDQSVLDMAQQELKKQYYSRGKYSVIVKTTVKHLERNRVSINFDIAEGLTAKIKQINLVGNKIYTEKELKKSFQLSTPGWFSWISKNDQYSKPKLQADSESLRSYYQDRGYLEFNINSQQVSLSDDMKDIFLTINMSEGKQYTITDIKFAGDTIVPQEELAKLVDIKPGEVYSHAKINAAIEAISARLGDEGYAFANVNPAPEIDKDKLQASFTFYIDPGHKIYVRHVNIAGNSHTKDEVIRREMRQLEAAPYAGWKIKRSKERLDLLGYFSDVSIETPLVADSTDQVDVNVTVTEKQTGNIQVGAGYSQAQGVVLSGGISQGNIFGTGNFLQFQVNTSKIARVADLSFTNPYATPDGVSLGYDLYERHYDQTTTTAVGNYQNDTIGAGLRTAVPISEYDSINFGLSTEVAKLNVYVNSPQQYIDFVDKYGDKNLTFLGSAGWARDTRDSSLFPTRGKLLRLTAEAGLPGGDVEYFKVTAQDQWFFPLSKNFTFLWNVKAGYAHGYGGHDLPFYSNFFAGGVDSVRGYQPSSLGPQAANGAGATGGNRSIVTNLEVLMPVPGVGSDKSTRISWFVDGGNVWGEPGTSTGGGFCLCQAPVGAGGMRYSTGIAFSWLAPVGPMKFSLAEPLNPKSTDQQERFQFSLGRLF